MRFPKLITALSLGFAASLSGATSLTQINRYASVDNKPSAAQINPLLTVQQVRFPQQVKTVGEALIYWVKSSGFRIDNAPLALTKLMAQPLPQVDRNLGPLTIQDGLLVLVGQDVFTLIRDPLSRTVIFKLQPKYTLSKGLSA